jgi:GH25 family lysozyme M1 (1,4-beta-N-acetylmuramidase)
MALDKYFSYARGERWMGSNLSAPSLIGAREGELSSTILIDTSVHITDVSFWQESIDFTRMKEAGIKGTIIRAGQRTWKDTRFDENWSKSKTSAMPRGSYWFYDSRETPKNQASLWWSIVKNDTGELLHVADFEESYEGSYGKVSHFQEFIQEFQRLSGLPNKRIGIYTGYYWWSERVGNVGFFKNYPLWLAWYSLMANVRTPLPWIDEELILWQYTSNGDGKLYGVSSGNIDLNYLRGNEEYYKNYFGLGSTTPPPENGEQKMTEYDLTVLVAGLNIRSGPGTSYPVTAASGLVKDDKVIADEKATLGDGSIWYKVKSASRGGTAFPITQPAWASSGVNNSLMRLDATRTVSDGFLPTLHVSFKGDGYPPIDIDWAPIES